MFQRHVALKTIRKEYHGKLRKLTIARAAEKEGPFPLISVIRVSVEAVLICGRAKQAIHKGLHRVVAELNKQKKIRKRKIDV